MKKTLVVVAALVVVAGLAVGGWWGIRHSPAAREWLQARLPGAEHAVGAAVSAEASEVLASGFIEADVVQVRAERSGRVLSVHVNEGDSVERDQVLVQLDDTLIRQQIAVADADVELAQALLERAKAGVKADTLRRAEAEVTQAEAVQEAAKTAWLDAQVMVENPQEIDLALSIAQGQLEVLRHREAQAKALADAGQIARGLADESLQILEGLPSYIRAPAAMLRKARESQAAATYSSWAAWTGLDQAMAARHGAESLVAELTRQREHPLALQAQLDAAAAQLGIATAAVALAESQVQGFEMGAMPEQVAVAAAQVEIAKAARQALEAQLEQFVMKAPAAGLILSRSVGTGEVVAEGMAALSLANLNQLTLTVYVPESELGQIEIGQTVSVAVDAFPNRGFQGVVQGFGSEAEYTPRNVQTHEEKANIVFSVEISISNSDGALKPGMPADVRFSNDREPGAPALPGAARIIQSRPFLSASGSIECDELSVVSELGGKVGHVLVDEGDEVATGESVVELDSRALAARLVEARAIEAGALASLAQVRAGTNPSEVLAAKASLAKANAERSAAESAWRDAEAWLQDLPDVSAEIVQAQTALAVAAAQVEQAKAEISAIETERDHYQAQGSLEEKELYVTLDYQVAAARSGLEAAKANVQALRSQLTALNAILDDPLAATSAVHAAKSRCEVAAAAVAVAQARLDELQAGPSAEEVRAAEAQVSKAQAAAQLVQTQLDRLTLRAPIAGVVTSLLIHPGEVCAAGAVLATVSVLDEVSLVLYIAAEDLGAVQVGQATEVQVDAYPAKVFPGRVFRIAQQAEFAPNDVQTDEDRASMVFAVRVRLPNPQHQLRPGMTADARLLAP